MDEWGIGEGVHGLSRGERCIDRDKRSVDGFRSTLRVVNKIRCRRYTVW
jgi:hypothetical protein